MQKSQIAAGGQWQGAVRRELLEGILPFWQTRMVDREGDGFHGKIAYDLTVDRAAPRAAVLNARILWTFSAAARLFGDAYLATARRAFAYIATRFVDPRDGGLFWEIGPDGTVLSDRKQIYAQAFGIYALAEYARATGDQAGLALAKHLYALVEAHSLDAVHGGYIEARARDWSALRDMRLSEKDMNCPKSMNTHLHVMEAYTNLLRVWRDPGLVARQSALMHIMLERVFDARSGHLVLFFDDAWRPASSHVSFGHDIEASWLLMEAAEVLGDPGLLARAREATLRLADTAYRQGRDGDGSLFYEADACGRLVDANKHWWAQAEAVVGFFNAHQVTGEARYGDAARAAWAYIEAKIVDRRSGEWFAKLSPHGAVITEAEDGDACLAGPWKCPYHNARACMEVLARLAV